ncbi:DNA helicase-2/ATP-dependent DNA helicase PcrA [Nocardia transvalensis]|uniref:DNA 3'-5' helicase n=1 Tax=Nocardia transvalensis TaxID=37333 RepID=A0A7W9PA05_9NOCA|nr:UvrD-helicase domain-containing protein [Nocardia transvalensis]MBB5912247.1 DNA helicase-2/ATP-dependent DNA helicase PcrA [Nocardia transvalensis]
MSGPVTPEELAEALGLPPPTAEQAAVIAAPPGPTLVVAGAGAGKTETMAARVVWMVANGLVAPDAVLGLTFTRKAAQQLTTRIRTRLARLAGAPLLREIDPSGRLRARLTGSEPEISTYHSYAGRLLGEHGLLLPVEPNATLLTETQLWQLAHRVVTGWDGDLDTDRTPVSVTEAVLALSGQLAEHLVEAEQLAEAHTELEKLILTLPRGPRQRGGPSQELLGILAVQHERVALLPLVRRLGEELRRRGALDFGAQMSLAARLAAEHAEVGIAERDRFRLVLLDEYQDTGHAQRILLAALFGDLGNAQGSDSAAAQKDRVPDAQEDSGLDTHQGSGPVVQEGWGPAAQEGSGPVVQQGSGPVVQQGSGPAAQQGSGPVAQKGSGTDAQPEAAYGFGGGADSVLGGARADPAVVGGLGEGGQRLAVTAVGDPMQSIYGWRGASAANLPRFATDFPSAPGVPAPILPLLTSWRNPPEALELANLVAEPLRDVEGGVTVDALRPRPGADAGTVALALAETVAAEREWVAERIAAEWETRADAGVPPPTSAVLVRRNADAAPLAEALRERGLPVEIVGLGGLLATPEVADVVATLRLIADPAAGSAAVRILTGARWRLGVSDLAALARRARDLSITRPPEQAAAITDSAGLAEALRTVAPEPAERAGLADAIADPGAAEQYSDDGYARIVDLGRELAALRERSGQSLPELVADVERTIGVGVETQARRASAGGGAGREHLDAFAEVVADYTSDHRATLPGLLTFLAAAEEVENGLEPGEVEVARDRVQILTVHAAKGLEWEVVAVPHVARGVFPSGTAAGTWLGALAELPTTLRGDRQRDSADGVPVLDLSDLYDRSDLDRAIKQHKDALNRRRLDEERRLFYVALTRTERVLFVSAHHWAETGSTPKGPSDFLLDLKHAVEHPDSALGAAVRIDLWADPPATDAVNPFTDDPASAQWPRDPLGRRRAAVREGADLVRAALKDLPPEPDPRHDEGAAADGSPLGETSQNDAARAAGEETFAEYAGEPGGQLSLFGDPADETPGPVEEPRGEHKDSSPADDDPEGWAADVDALLSEHFAAGDGVREVELPGQLPATALVELRADPAKLAARLRRPLPYPPSPFARRGTAFHAWLQQWFGSTRLLGLDELPGAADSGGADADLVRLQESFLSSPWADRNPAEVEVAFETSLAGTLIRGRMDAVFAEPGGRWLVVDWKTGAEPTRAEEAAVSMQLAVYRLAWARLLAGRLGADEHEMLEKIDAAFHYVRTGRTIKPPNLPGPEELAEFLTTAAPSWSAASEETSG